MSKAEFTKAPWMVHADTFIYALNDNDENAFDFNIHGYNTDRSEILANARLRVKAPAMYNLLDKISKMGLVKYEIEILKSDEIKLLLAEIRGDKS